MAGSQNATANANNAAKIKDKLSDKLIDWLFCNVLFPLFPWLCALLAKIIGNINLTLLKITPDFLLSGFAVAVCVQNYIEDSYLEGKRQKNLRHIPQATCFICAFMYAELFGEFSMFEALNQNKNLIILNTIIFAVLLINVITVIIIQVKEYGRSL